MEDLLQPLLVLFVPLGQGGKELLDGGVLDLHDRREMGFLHEGFEIPDPPLRSKPGGVIRGILDMHPTCEFYRAGH